MTKKRGFEIAKGYGSKNILLPERKTTNSAGYDFHLPEKTTFKKGEKTLIKTGVKAYMGSDEVLILHMRSSLGVKRLLRFANTTGIIDSDYYQNDKNDGNIGAVIVNDGETDLTLEKGDSFMQGIFQKYLISDNGNSNEIRKGGLGSTTKAT